MLQKAENFPGAGAIDVCLFEESQLGRHVSVERLHELNNLIMSSWFLTTKLIARESKNFEPPRMEFVIQLRKLGIVGRSKASLGGDVDEKEDVSNEPRHFHLVSVHVTIHELRERRLGNLLLLPVQDFCSSILDRAQRSKQGIAHGQLRRRRRRDFDCESKSRVREMISFQDSIDLFLFRDENNGGF